MIKFKDRTTDKNGSIRYNAFRNGQIIESYWPCNDDYQCKGGVCKGTQGDAKWSKFISKEAIDFINYGLIEKKMKPLTPSEEKQVFDFYFKGDILGIKEEIKKHKEEIKKLKEKLKNG